MTVRFLPLAVFTTLSYLAAGCTPAAESSIQAEVTDNAGVRVVFSRAPKWVEGQEWRVSPEPTTTIGVLEGPEEYQLVNVVDAARRSDGSLVIVDAGAQVIRHYSPGGAFLKTLGGPGSGPGEFTGPTSVLVTPGDSMVVWDQALLRATRFGPDGELSSVQTVDWGKLAGRVGAGESKLGGSVATAKAVFTGLFPGAMEPTEDGRLLVRLIEKTAKTPPSGYHRSQSAALLVTVDLSTIDTLMFFGDTEQVTVDAPWGPFSLAPPLARHTEIAHKGAPSRICVGDQGGPEIVCFSSEGRQTAFRWIPEPVRLNQTDLSEWREWALEYLGPKLSRDQILEMVDLMPLPEYRPPYSRILLDPAGNLWVEKGPAEESAASVDYLVFDLDGVLLGVTTLPPIQVMEIGLDYVIGVHRDELEVQYLWIHELGKPGSKTQ